MKAVAQLRLDADVTDLVGFAQPANCSTITGVVANYFATQQLLRMRTDFPCANKYQQTGDDLYANDKTFDIAT
jgi:hypothetical protein